MIRITNTKNLKKESEVNKIKFSHKYEKLIGSMINIDEPVCLLAVFKEHKKNLSLAFLDYDTSYTEILNLETGECVNRNYPLRDTEYLILLFSQGYKLFTTMRASIGRYGKDKEEYYRSKQGREFEIVITEPEEQK